MAIILELKQEELNKILRDLEQLQKIRAQLVKNGIIEKRKFWRYTIGYDATRDMLEFLYQFLDTQNQFMKSLQQIKEERNTNKIDRFNEDELPDTLTPYKEYTLRMLGGSDVGIVFKDDEFKGFIKVEQFVKDLKDMKHKFQVIENVPSKE